MLDLDFTKIEITTIKILTHLNRDQTIPISTYFNFILNNFFLKFVQSDLDLSRINFIQSYSQTANDGLSKNSVRKIM